MTNLVDLGCNLKKTLNPLVADIQRYVYRMQFSLPVLYKWKVRQGSLMLQITY